MAELLCKYYKRQRYVSYNDGVTWQPLDEYEQGELYESHSADCGGGTYQYRWVLVSNGYICDGKDKYTREIYQYSEDGVVWYNTFPTQYRKGSLVESNSPYCDNAGEGHYTSGDTEPISGDTYCPPNYEWNGYDCVCKGHIINGKCIGCENVKHEHWDDSQQMCVCDRWYERRNGICVYVDPLKIVKCSEANGVIQKSDVDYYESGWAAMSYKIGDCVTKIGDNAFNGQIFLTSATISNTVTEIGNLAFANCRSLETITFPNDITSFGNNVFLQCSSLKNVTFGGTIPSEVPIGMFAQCENLQSVSWLQYNNITSIGGKAFYNCYSLGNVTLPDTLQTIDENAFYGNRSMTNITIPASVSYIGHGAFRSCRALTQVTINSDSTPEAKSIDSPEYITKNSSNNGSIDLGVVLKDNTKFQIKFKPTNNGGGAILGESDAPSDSDDYRFFWSNGRLYYDYGSSRLNVTQSINTIYEYEIGNYYIKNMSTSATVLTSDTKTGVATSHVRNIHLLYGNTDYADVYYLKVYEGDTLVKDFIPWTDGKGSYGLFDKVTNVVYASNGQLTGSSSTTEYVYYDNSIYIGDKAFSECPTLTSATINTDKVVLGSNVFDGCTSLLKITFTATVPPQISQTALDNSNECKIFVPCDSEEAYKTAWPQYADRISCNDTGIYYRWIDADGFYCDGTDEYTRQKEQQTTNGITWIDTGEYRQSTFITHYSKNCGYVGDVLLTVTNEDGHTRYHYPCDKDAYKFISEYKNGEMNYVLCNSDSNLSQNEVSPSSAMTSAEIGDCITTIGERAFASCSSLTSIVIPSGVTSIGNGTFYDCSGLTSIEIPSGVASISREAFNNCYSLTSVIIPNSVTSISSRAFRHCTSLTSIEIPDSVTSIGGEAFQGCSGLTSVTIPNSVTSIGDASFWDCESLTSVTISDSVQTIGEGTFTACYSLPNITIPDSVTSIGSYAFQNCIGLTSVTIGSGITYIGERVFNYCKALTSITVEALTPPTLGEYAFDGTNCSIYVPAASVNIYTAAKSWNRYSNRIQPIP